MQRLRGELFALLTLAVTFVIATIVLNTPIDGGPGVYMSAVPVPELGADAVRHVLPAGLRARASLTLAHRLVASRMRGSALGLFAIHDDEDVAEVMGVPTYRYKLAAFALSARSPAWPAASTPCSSTYVTVGETFSITVPLYVVLMSVLGGTRHWAGPAVGASADHRPALLLHQRRRRDRSAAP